MSTTNDSGDNVNLFNDADNKDMVIKHKIISLKKKN